MNYKYLNFLMATWRDKKSQQKGIALLVTFFIMGVSVALVLGVSVILLSELKMIRGMGNSVVVFYTAETGIEKTLYYDRKVKDGEWDRGICNICNSCADDGCVSCSAIGADCGPSTCSDCQIMYNSWIGEKKFQIKAIVSPTGDTVKSYGTFLGVSRAIELSGIGI